MVTAPALVGRSTSALIGHTGLVGSNLLRQRKFDDCYNSANIEDIRGKRYDLLVCSGARGTKWIANRDSKDDYAGISNLIENVRHVHADLVVLISTVDVYAVPVGVDEASPITHEGQSPYGRHRYYLEEVIREQFSRVLVVRLPALFGPGLRKNALYDLMCEHEVEKINPKSTYQYYALDHISSHIDICLAAGLSLCNLATPPVCIRDLAAEILGRDLSGDPSRWNAPAAYDFRTRFAHLFGGRHGYICDRATMMDEIRSFVKTYRGRKGVSHDGR